MFEEEELELHSTPYEETFEGFGVSPIPQNFSQSPFMDKVFEREFKQTMAYIKSMSPTVFGLHHLELTQSPIGSELLSFVKIKGLSSENLFKELEECEFVFISTKKEFSEKGHLAYSKLNLQSVKASKGYRLIACASALPIPNGYKSPDPQIEYVGQDEIMEGAVLQYFWIAEEFLYRVETEVVTVSLKRVSDHLGGRSVVLTNGISVYLVVQDRSRMRNTETKNIYFVGNTVEECKEQIVSMYNRLVELGLAFPSEEFTIQKEIGGILTTVNLAYKELEPTMDLDPVAFEVSLAEEG